MPYRRASLSATFHALADPRRRHIIERLEDGSASVSELAVPLEVSLPAVLQHLAVLEASGLVRTHKVGRTRLCELRHEALREVEDWVATLHPRSAT